MGNTERGHFHETLEAYTAENKYMSDIVKYFVRPSSLRPDVIQFIKRYHTDCPVCNALYLQINRNMSMSQSTQDIRKISTTHHENNS
jgi:glycerol-3-phosphate dehydrogenase